MAPAPDYWFLTRGGSLDDAAPEKHFDTLADAKAEADRLNEVEVIESLDIPGSHRARFDLQIDG